MIMKKITLLLSFIVIAFVSNAITPINETFTGCTVGALANQDSWTTAGTLSAGAGRTVNSTALTYSNSGGTYVLSGIGKSLNVEITSCSDYKSYKTLSSGAISSGVVYVSFLYKAGIAQSQTGIEIFGLATGTSAGPRIWVGKSATTGYWKFGITRMSTTSNDCAWNSGEYNNVNEVLLLVMKYDFSTAAASFYINPLIGGSEPSSPAASAPITPLPTGEGTGRSSLNNLWFRSTGSSSYKYNIGNIRVSSTWAEAVASQAVKLTTPTIGSATDATGVGFTANWTPVNNASGYEIKVYSGTSEAGTYSVSGQSATSKIITGLTANTTYTYKVQAIGNGTTFSNSDQSSASAEVTTLNISKLSVPALGTTTSINTSGFTANWDAVANAVSYDVIVKLNSTVVGTYNSDTNSKTITGLIQGLQYTFTVTANGDGINFANSDPSTSASVITSGVQNPVASAASSITTNGFTANWGTVLNAIGYNVEVYIGTSRISTTNVTGQSSTSSSITGLSMGTSYTYKVIAYDDNGNNGTSNSVSFLTTSSTVSTITTDFNDNTWGPVSATSYTTGSFPSTSINGFELTAAGLNAGSTKGPRAETHTNRISVDKSTNGGKVTFPTVNSLEQIEIHLSFGSGDKDFLLKEYNSSTGTWTQIGDYTYNMASKNAAIDSIYIIPVSRNVPSKFRIENNTTSGLFIYQIITRTTNPALLTKPVVQAASEISSTGFTANWSAVDNATSYKVLLYQGSALVGTFDATGQATQSTVISGLTPNTAYTYKVQAIGNDNVDFSDSFLSVASGVTTSNSFNITDTKSISALSTLNASSSVEVSTGAILNVDAVKTINNITVNPGAKMNVNALFPLTVSTLTLKSDKDDTSFSVKLDAGITATNARLFKTIDDTKWYFMSFPCDVAVSSITKSNGDPFANLGTDWFIKYYDGNKRANDGVSNGSNWVSVTSGTLTAKKGYIFGLKTGTPETELFIPLNTEILSTESESSIPVMSYNSGLAAEVHKGWNLIGQPYLSRFAAQTGSDAPFMVVPNIDGKTYSVKSKAIGTLPEINPMSAYFVQSATDGNINFGLNGRQSVRSLVEKNVIDYLQLKFSNNSGIDDTYLILDDNQSTAYQIGQDMEKWLGTGSDKPQIYSTLGNVKFAFNALPVNSVNNLIIGTYSKTSGLATISADASQTSGISNILLKDNDNGIVTDLLATDYHFTAGEGINENRFSLTIQKISTDTKKDAELNSTIVSLKNGRIVINNAAELKSIQVYDAVGHLLTNINPAQNTVELPVLVKGIYNIKIQTNNKTRTIKMMI